MPTAVAGRGTANAAADKEPRRFYAIGRIFQFTAIIFAVWIAMEIALGFMACYYCCSARRALSDENAKSDMEGFPDIPSIADADQLEKIEQIVNNIPTEDSDYAFFSEKACVSKKNDQDPMHEKMAFGSNMKSACEVLEEVKSQSLGNAFARGRKNITIFEEFIALIDRVRAKYEQLNEEIGMRDGDYIKNENMFNLDKIELVATS